MHGVRYWVREYGFIAAMGVLAMIGLGIWWASSQGEAAAPVPTPSQVVVAPSPSESIEASPSESASPSPSVEASASADREVPAGQTVLFRGGPATGPWQQIGSVAEITHPDAPETARFAYAEFWSDPEEENQSDERWDEIVAEVAAQAVELGPPADREAFGGVEESVSFNAFGGMQDVYRDEEVFTAFWVVTWLDGADAVRTYFPYLLTFDGEVIERGETFEFRESEGLDSPGVTDAAIERLRTWAEELGYGAPS